MPYLRVLYKRSIAKPHPVASVGWGYRRDHPGYLKEAHYTKV
jgi:hypothetical protein